WYCAAARSRWPAPGQGHVFGSYALYRPVKRFIPLVRRRAAPGISPAPPRYLGAARSHFTSFNQAQETDMMNRIDRREFLKLAALGGVGVVFASALPGVARAHDGDDFFFLQLSDTHWGFEGPPNPDAKGTLRKAVRSINGLGEKPDFIMFTGDLTHTTDDPVERRSRLSEFRDIVSELEVKTLRFMPGEHDASLDNGKAFQEFFGSTHYTFDHKGVHFIVLDNESDPRAQIGEAPPASPATY